MKNPGIYRLFVWACAAVMLLSCGGGSKRKVPDVSHIKVKFEVKRFDQELFSLDTTDLGAALTRLQQHYPGFLNDYLYNILALPPQEDSTVAMLKRFIHDYKPVYDSVQLRYRNLGSLEKELVHALQLTGYYFPGYKLPESLITFVGPVEGYANVLTNSGFAVGLQLYLGKDFSAYQMDYFREIYPSYQSKRFEAVYIPVNCMRNIVDDMYPYKAGNRPLAEQMVELGKRMYLLDLLLPETAEHLKLGYTEKQLEGCYKHEALIWNTFVQNDLLYATDPIVIRDYVNDGPKTPVLGEESPGFIGQFTGWQIVKKWAEKQKDLTPQELMRTPARQLFDEAKYKPR
ncbi:gliding motility lipoprotein GldB [Filimonas effusa]|nr:hypothetical protein [Filimonas effusa]